ncbi:hypothetical protein EZ045_08760 [Enterococcus faecalis]|nr:hypothetical protein [Enterococcus faecalis]
MVILLNKTFFSWIKQFDIETLRHPFRDLSREIKKDNNFPKTTDPKILYQYMDEHFSHYLARKTFKKALILYLLDSDKGSLNEELGNIQWFSDTNLFIDEDLD